MHTHAHTHTHTHPGKSLLRKPFIERRQLMYDSFAEVEGLFTFAKKKGVCVRAHTLT